MKLEYIQEDNPNMSSPVANGCSGETPDSGETPCSGSVTITRSNSVQIQINLLV